MLAEKPIVKFKKRTERTRLNKRTVESLSLPPMQNGRPAQAWVYDDETRRLAICSWSTGAKTWYWIGRLVNGRMMRHKLGEFPEMPPEQAKKAAAKISADVANGSDPRQERRRIREEMTLGDLFDRYLEEHAKLHKRTWEDDDAAFRRYCQSLKARPVSAIDRMTVMTLHARTGKDKGRYAANRLLALLSSVFSFARTIGYEGGNPCQGVQKFREESRDRFLSADELRRFFAALELETQLFQDFFALLLFIGARRGNVQAMRFEQIDFASRVWRIPRTKNDDSLTVPLHADALEILIRRQAESDGCEWVFPGGKKNQAGHLEEPKGAWQRITKRAGLVNLRMHDLRRTHGSWMAGTGVSLPIIGKSLGHKSAAATAIYSRLALDPVRAAVDMAVAAMKAAANGSREGAK